MQAFLETTKCLLKSVEKNYRHSQTIDEFPLTKKESSVRVFYDGKFEESQDERVGTD